MSEPFCPDCGAEVGVPHAGPCDVARCLRTGLQRLSCQRAHDHGSDTWTGLWPGESDAIALGLWARPVPGRGWVPCDMADEGAQPDLNRLVSQYEWDPTTGAWQRPSGA